jgi:hypothetical protein
MKRGETYAPDFVEHKNETLLSSASRLRTNVVTVAGADSASWFIKESVGRHHRVFI